MDLHLKRKIYSRKCYGLVDRKLRNGNFIISTADNKIKCITDNLLNKLTNDVLKFIELI
jgi:hypothetical protein